MHLVFSDGQTARVRAVFAALATLLAATALAGSVASFAQAAPVEPYAPTTDVDGKLDAGQVQQVAVNAIWQWAKRHENSKLKFTDLATVGEPKWHTDIPGGNKGAVVAHQNGMAQFEDPSRDADDTSSTVCKRTVQVIVRPRAGGGFNVIGKLTNPRAKCYTVITYDPGLFKAGISVAALPLSLSDEEPPQPPPDADGQLSVEQVQQIMRKTLWLWGKKQEGEFSHFKWTPRDPKGVKYPYVEWHGKVTLADVWPYLDPKWYPTVVGGKLGTLVARQVGYVQWYFNVNDDGIYEIVCERTVQVYVKKSKDGGYTIGGRMMPFDPKKCYMQRPIS